MLCYACYAMHAMQQPPTRGRTLARTDSIEAGNGELLETTYYYTPLVFAVPEIRKTTLTRKERYPEIEKGAVRGHLAQAILIETR